VYTQIVRNITLSAEDELIDRARLRAAQEKTTLNAAFREWLARYAGSETSSQEYRELMKRLRHVRPGRHFLREELNQR
jgi:hypothetical protein